MRTAKGLFQSEYISYSRLASYEQCPQRFKLQYLDRLPCPVGRAAQLGTLVHAVIADYLLELKEAGGKHRTDLGALERRIVPKCQELRLAGEITEQVDEDEASGLLEGFTLLMPEVDARAVDGVEVERDFVVSGYRCKAILDLVLRKADGRVTILDFKTGKPRYTKDLQLRFYALPFVGSPDASSVDAAFAFLRTGELTSVAVDREAAKETIEAVLRRVQVIEADREFEGDPGPLCSYCGVREHCAFA